MNGNAIDGANERAREHEAAAARRSSGMMGEKPAADVFVQEHPEGDRKVHHQAPAESANAESSQRHHDTSTSEAPAWKSVNR
jgi:hypothetical protein